MSYSRVNLQKIQLEDTLRCPSACAKWEAFWLFPLWGRTCYTELHPPKRILPPCWGEQCGHHTGHDGSSHRAWVPFLLRLFPLVTGGHAPLPAAVLHRDLVASLHHKGISCSKTVSAYIGGKTKKSNVHMWSNKYLVAHYKLTKVPNAAPTILNRFDCRKNLHSSCYILLKATLSIQHTKNMAEGVIFSIF